MKRFTIVSRLLVTPAPSVVGYADTPQEAVSIAHKATQDGKRDVRIGDNQAEKHFDTESFAKQYGVR
ncbi:MAG TPA: hypothetical protein VEA80_03760 [Vitreimonas sp.]|uniref:hypothetical protein n=1 Tax=Vitreimonas sp. TaxID=3069702 RepID=UPI002D27532D|nr:hypothetical protein [Vitreimonas sp.]HYD86566.1 hypothetical protein [Vitreimonas sp.]